MFKIRLLILLLISFFITSCTNNQTPSFNQKYSLAYIGGGSDGLLLKNYLLSSLKNLDIYDANSNYEIRSNINHSYNVFITNIDNTSDREKISTNLSFQIINTSNNCQVLSDQITISQFYIYASSDKFLSNKTAVNKIKKDNTESLVSKLINKLSIMNNRCNE
ncbi:hypothetical protein N9W28_04970 [Alphaproteobacteria bacterium]|nr:hypothetical protein [Alphaproteobacteria bacterium]